MSVSAGSIDSRQSGTISTNGLRRPICGWFSVLVGTVLYVNCCCSWAAELTPSEGAANDQSFAIEGIITPHSPDAKSESGFRPEKGKTRHFSAVVDGQQWWMRIVSDDTPSDFDVASSDGTNTYYLSSLETVASKSNQPVNTAVASILPGTIPKCANREWTIPYLWLAFASHSEASKFPHGRIPVVSPANTVNRFNLTNSWAGVVELESTKPKMLRRFVSMHPGFIPTWTNEVAGPWVASPEHEYLPSPFDRGFTNEVYSVMEWTNVAGMFFPSVSVHESFYPDVESEPPGQLGSFGRLVIVCTNVVVGSTIIDGRPKVAGLQVACADYRFALDKKIPVPVDGGLFYQFSNSWLSDAEAFTRLERLNPSQNTLDRLANIRVAEAEPKGLIRSLLLGVILFAAPVIWLLVRPTNRKKER